MYPHSGMFYEDFEPTKKRLFVRNHQLALVLNEVISMVNNIPREGITSENRERESRGDWITELTLSIIGNNCHFLSLNIIKLNK